MMRAKWAVALAALLFGIIAATDTWAHGRGRPRVSFGLHLGVPLYGYHYAPPPHYYYPYYGAPVIVQSAPPPVYVERYVEQQPPPADSTGPQGPVQHYWYYCRETETYFPYVKECPGGWQRVVPQAPPQ